MHRGQELDLPSRSLRLSSAGQDARQVTYDLLVGADGASSRVRDALAHEVSCEPVSLSHHGVHCP